MRSMICCALLCFAVANQARAAEVKRQAIYKTPQAVFEAAKKAMLANDVKSYLQLLTDNSLEVMSFAMLEAAVPEAQPDFPGDNPKIKARQKKIRAILAKHGITSKVQKELRAAHEKKAMREPAKKILKEKVKDRIQLMADFAKLLTDEGAKPVPTDMQLIGLTLIRNKAMGTTLTVINNHKERGSMLFEKVGQSWKIVIRDEK